MEKWIVGGVGTRARQRGIVELETKVKRKFAKVSIVSYSRPSLMICLLTVGSTPV